MNAQTPRAPERLESWMVELPLSEVQKVRQRYHESGDFDATFQLATQLKVARRGLQEGGPTDWRKH